METLYSWTARRSGPNMTIIHSCGKLSGIREIAPNENGQLVASKGDEGYLLATPPHLHADHVSTGVSDLFFNNEDACEAFRTDHDMDRHTRMQQAADDFRTMLKAAGISAPTAGALVSDFLGRV